MKHINWRQPLTILLGIVAVCALFTLYATGNIGMLMTALAASGAVFGMILDERTEFMDATSIVNATGLLLIGDVYDLGKAGQIESRPRLYLVIQIATAVAATGGASETEFTLASDAQAAIAVDGSATVHWKSGPIPKATLVAGYTIIVPLPDGRPPYERYLGVLVGITTFAVTTGAVNAFLTTNPKVWKAFPDGNAGI